MSCVYGEVGEVLAPEGDDVVCMLHVNDDDDMSMCCPPTLTPNSKHPGLEATSRRCLLVGEIQH